EKNEIPPWRPRLPSQIAGNMATNIPDGHRRRNRGAIARCESQIRNEKPGADLREKRPIQRLGIDNDSRARPQRQHFSHVWLYKARHHDEWRALPVYDAGRLDRPGNVTRRPKRWTKRTTPPLSRANDSKERRSRGGKCIVTLG